MLHSVGGGGADGRDTGTGPLSADSKDGNGEEFDTDIFSGDHIP